MRGSQLAWRALLVVAIFVVVGVLTDHILVARAVARGVPEYDERLAGAMGGLFVGGAAACLVALALLFGRGGRSGPKSGE